MPTPTGYYPFYTGYADERGAGAGLGCNLNLPVPHGADTEAFMRCLQPGLAAIRDFAPGALVVALGFDGYRDDPISVLYSSISTPICASARPVAALALPTVVVQEGGYLVEAIGPALDRFPRRPGRLDQARGSTPHQPARKRANVAVTRRMLSSETAASMPWMIPRQRPVDGHRQVGRQREVAAVGVVAVEASVAAGVPWVSMCAASSAGAERVVVDSATVVERAVRSRRALVRGADRAVEVERVLADDDETRHLRPQGLREAAGDAGHRDLALGRGRSAPPPHRPARRPA